MIDVGVDGGGGDDGDDVERTIVNVGCDVRLLVAMYVQLYDNL